MIAEIKPNLYSPQETDTQQLVLAPPRWRSEQPNGRATRRRGSQLRVGIVTCSRGAWDVNGHFRMAVGEGRLMNAILERFPDSRVCVPVVDKVHPHFRQALDVEQDNLEPLPAMTSIVKAQKYALQVRRTIRRFAETVDVLYVRLPFAIPRALKGLKTPKLLHVCGDTSEVVRVSNDYRGLWRLAARAQAWDMDRTTRQLVAEPSTRTAAHGRELWQKLGCRDGRVVVSSCLREHEMQPHENRQLGDPPRLLFVGYLRPEKGVPCLLKAFHEIRSQRRVKLTLVGGADRVSRAQQEIHRMIEESPYRDDIELTGLLPFGQQLFDAYREHDICVQPSLSEGTPRTLIEARAFGCPVVSTRVGGIPTSVDDGRDGLLVEPENPTELAAALRRVLDDAPLRNRLIDAGYKTAQAHSLERFADELGEELEILGEEHLSPAFEPAAPAFPAGALDLFGRFGVAVNS